MKLLTEIDAEIHALEDYGSYSALIVAQAIGTFADDPADSAFQRAYLKGLWQLLHIKMLEEKLAP